MADPSAPLYDGAWYAARADEFGWGPKTAVVDPERAQALRTWATGSVLDVGCATGIHVDLLVRAGHEARGLDHAESLVAWARAHRRGAFDVGDAYALPYPDDGFDTVLALDVLEHLDDERALAEMVRVARRRLILAVPAATPPALRKAGLLLRHHEDPSHRRVYARDDVEALVRGAGLEPAHVEGQGAVDLNGLLLDTIRHPSAWRQRLAHRLVFKVLRHVPPRRYESEWLAVADLPACRGDR